MAFGDVAKKLSEPTNPSVLNLTVGDGGAIAKGALCYLSGDNTASTTAAGSIGLPFAGIAAAEKVASDGSTTLGFQTCGVYDMVAGNTIALGQLVMISGANSVCPLGAGVGSYAISGGLVVGKALEAADSGETIAVAVGYY